MRVDRNAVNGEWELVNGWIRHSLSTIRHSPSEGAEAFVQVAHKLLWRKHFAHGGEAFEICEEYGHLIDEIRARLALCFEFFGDLLG
jgi:hypothetical protein